MLKKAMTFKNFDGETVTKNFYFHLSEVELLELELGEEGGGFRSKVKRIIESENVLEIHNLFKEFVLLAYGERSADGERFMKSDEIRANFQQTAAYSDLLFGFIEDPSKAAEFVNGLVPEKFRKSYEEGLKLDTSQTIAAPATTPAPVLQAPTGEVDLNSMTPEQIKKHFGFNADV